MVRKILESEKYGMVICPRCNGQGYIPTPKRRRCPKCEGFGYVTKETEEDANTSTNGDY